MAGLHQELVMLPVGRLPIGSSYLLKGGWRSECSNPSTALYFVLNRNVLQQFLSSLYPAPYHDINNRLATGIYMHNLYIYIFEWGCGISL